MLTPYRDTVAMLLGFLTWLSFMVSTMYQCPGRMRETKGTVRAVTKATIKNTLGARVDMSNATNQGWIEYQR
jgi:hypothetical protein